MLLQRNCEFKLVKDREHRVYGFWVTSLDGQDESERLCRELRIALKQKRASLAVRDNRLIISYVDDDDHTVEVEQELLPSEVLHVQAMVSDSDHMFEVVRISGRKEIFRYNVINWNGAQQGN